MATYHITDIAGLIAIADDMAGDYLIDNDISGEITLIGKLVEATFEGVFTGTLNGRGHILTLVITPNLDNNVDGVSSLFLSAGIYESPAAIKNIIFKDCTSVGHVDASILARDLEGTVSNIKFINCLVSTWYRGGMLISNSSVGTISKIYSDSDCVLIHDGDPSNIGGG